MYSSLIQVVAAEQIADRRRQATARRRVRAAGPAARRGRQSVAAHASRRGGVGKPMSPAVSGTGK
jgi:hypothetical protein